MNPDPKRVAAVMACERALDHVKKIGALYDSIVELATNLTRTATEEDPRIPLELPEQPIVWAQNIATELEQQSQAFRACVEELRAAVSPEMTEALAESLRAESAAKD